MRMDRLIWLLMAGWIVLSCGKGVDSGEQALEEEPSIGLSIEFPQHVVTKGAVGELPASEEENALHSLSVWVFCASMEPCWLPCI